MKRMLTSPATKTSTKTPASSWSISINKGKARTAVTAVRAFFRLPGWTPNRTYLMLAFRTVPVGCAKLKPAVA